MIIAVTTVAADALRQQTLSIPIVFVLVADPVGQGFVTNLARPEGNITGFTNFEFSMGGKWLQVLKECAPGVNAVAWFSIRTFQLGRPFCARSSLRPHHSEYD
jgi:putative tryptophan/tyrosine transport system substrate-binding protein